MQEDTETKNSTPLDYNFVFQYTIRNIFLYSLVHFLENLLLNIPQEGFIKTAEKPINGLSSEQKAKLNRKGNEFFNNNDIQSAERIFMTTGYSDGLTRIGDYYMVNNKKLQALKLYRLAHNTSKEDMILDELAAIIKLFI